MARGSPCVRPDICLPRLNKACPNPSKWRESLRIRGARPGYRVSALALACPFRGKRGDYFKGLYWDGSGMWLIAKRLERGRFVWPPIVDGTMTLTPALLSAVAEAERDRTRERVAEVKRDQRQRGRYLAGAVPWGYRVGEAGELVPIPEQQAAIRRMRKLRDQGLALRAIADQMKASGVSISHARVKNSLSPIASRYRHDARGHADRP